MEAPEDTGGNDGGEAPDYEVKEEEFTDLEMAGGTWSGTLITVKGDGWESKVWTADNGWFNGVIKTETSGMVTELVAFGDDGEAQLKWKAAEEEKEDPVTGEKKEDEEKKEEEEEADDMD